MGDASSEQSGHRSPRATPEISPATSNCSAVPFTDAISAAAAGSHKGGHSSAVSAGSSMDRATAGVLDLRVTSSKSSDPESAPCPTQALGGEPEENQWVLTSSQESPSPGATLHNPRAIRTLVEAADKDEPTPPSPASSGTRSPIAMRGIHTDDSKFKRFLQCKRFQKKHAPPLPSREFGTSSSTLQVTCSLYSWTTLHAIAQIHNMPAHHLLENP